MLLFTDFLVRVVTTGELPVPGRGRVERKV